MKKRFLILASLASLGMVACGGSGNVELKSQQDSVAYALGLDVAHQFYNNIDSTMNYELMCQGIVDAFNKNGKIPDAEVNQFLQHYFQVILPAKKTEENEKLSAAFLKAAKEESGAQVSESGLVYNIENEGAEHKIADGDTVELHYTLIDVNGKVLQSSKESGKPMKYTVTPTAMIKGFTEGVAMLGEGGKADLYLPYEIAYGERGGGQIGPKQALKFEVEIVSVKTPAEVK